MISKFASDTKVGGLESNEQVCPKRQEDMRDVKLGKPLANRI